MHQIDVTNLFIFSFVHFLPLLALRNRHIEKLKCLWRDSYILCSSFVFWNWIVSDSTIHLGNLFSRFVFDSKRLLFGNGSAGHLWVVIQILHQLLKLANDYIHVPVYIKSSEKWKRLIWLFCKINIIYLKNRSDYCIGDWWTIDFILLTTIFV